MELMHHQQQNINKTINRIDKLRDSIKLSKRKIDSCQILTKKEKQVIITYITNDYAYNLSIYLQKRAIKQTTQIGMQHCGWNFLHFSVKCNALQCIEYLLKQQYKHYQQQYQKYVNQKTVQGYTAVMIAIINECNDALNILLKYGAVDIHAVDNKRMTAYQIAINYKNEKAIRSLMNYQNTIKKQRIVSKTFLNQPIVFVKRQESCCYKSFIALFQCLSFGLYSKISAQEIKSSNSSPRRSSLLNTQFFSQPPPLIDQIKISLQPSQELQYDILWKDLALIITNPKNPLFQNYNPFDISQKNIVLKNNLILFQCLSQYPWAVRKIVQIDRNKQQQQQNLISQTNNAWYNICLWINQEFKKFSINGQIPFLKDRDQPMFIQNHNEMWPMLLQKGLAKAHGSYFGLENIQPLQLLQQMTGFPTFQINIQGYQNLQIFNLLKQLHNKGYLYMLVGLQGSNLSNQGKKDCFSLLQIFDKGQRKLILVNCPFIDQVWKQKQKYQMHSLKLIKSHFNNHDQMCVWIEFDRIKQYFSKIIVSMTLPNYERKSFKAKVSKQIFFTFKVNKKRDEKIVIQLLNLNTKKTVNFHQIRAYMNQGSKRVTFQKGIQGQNFSQGVVSTQNLAGQYMCCIDFQQPLQNEFFEENIAESLIHSKIDKKPQNYMVIMWTVDGIEPRHLDQTLGPVQFLHWIKINSVKSWAQSQLYRIQIACDYALIIIKDRNESQKMYLTLETNQNDIIQGKYISSTCIELLQYQQKPQSLEKNFYFCILRNASHYNFTKKSSYIKNQQNLDPAGLSSTGKKLNFFSQ